MDKHDVSPSLERSEWPYGVAGVAGTFSVLLSTMPAGRQFLFSALFALLAAVTYFVYKWLQRVDGADDDTGEISR